MGIILVFVVVNIPQYGYYYTNATKDNWRRATGQLQSWLNSNDTIVVIPGYNQLPFDYYYRNTSDTRYFTFHPSKN